MRNKFGQEKYECDRCGFTYKKKQLKKQRGLLVCGGCYDDVREIRPVEPIWGSPRDNSLTTTAINTPTVFTITSAGVTTLAQSRPNEREGSNNDFHMYVIGDGPTYVLANPQITPAADGTTVTLQGTSSANPIRIANSKGVRLMQGTEIILGLDTIISFTYSTETGLWQETSRRGYGNDAATVPAIEYDEPGLTYESIYITYEG